MKLTEKIKYCLCGTPFIAISMRLFWQYIPYVFGKKPIDAIGKYTLENTPPPDWAVYFAINHGRAIYYAEKSTLEVSVAFIVFIFSGIAGAWFFNKAGFGKKNKSIFRF